MFGVFQSTPGFKVSGCMGFDIKHCGMDCCGRFPAEARQRFNGAGNLAA